MSRGCGRRSTEWAASMVTGRGPEVICRHAGPLADSREQAERHPRGAGGGCPSLGQPVIGGGRANGVSCETSSSGCPSSWPTAPRDPCTCSAAPRCTQVSQGRGRQAHREGRPPCAACCRHPGSSPDAPCAARGGRNIPAHVRPPRRRSAAGPAPAAPAHRQQGPALAAEQPAGQGCRSRPRPRPRHTRLPEQPRSPREPVPPRRRLPPPDPAARSRTAPLNQCLGLCKSRSPSPTSAAPSAHDNGLSHQDALADAT